MKQCHHNCDDMMKHKPMSDELKIQKNTLLGEIKNAIYDVRGQKVMLDFELAELYGYDTKRFNKIR